MKNRERWRASAIGVLLLICAAYVTVRFSGEAPLDTDILHALPLDNHDPVITDAITGAEAAAGRLVTLAVRGENADARRKAAQDLSGRLENTSYFIPLAKQGTDIARWLFTNRHEIVCPADQQRLAMGDGEAIARDAVAAIVIPGTPVTGPMIANDPFLLGYRLVRCLLPSPPVVDDAATLISGRLTVSGYRVAVQDAIREAITDWREKWSPAGITLDRSGAIFYAQAAGDKARSEISMIGGIGTISVILLLWVVFRRIYAPVFAVLTIGAGLLVGLAVCLAIFDTISVMTLVFGAALVGITVDYAIHYMMTAFTDEEETTESRLASIVRPLTICMITSGCGFLALVLFTSPVMTQIAVFASVGLIASWAFAIGVLPLIDKRRTSPGLAARGVAMVASMILSRPSKALSILGAIALGAVTVIGFAHFHTKDDVRAFQKLDANLKAEGDRIKNLTGVEPRVRLLLSRGSDEETAKRVEEAALALLEASDPLGTPSIRLATTRFDPSLERRRQTREFLRTHLFDPLAAEQAHRFGLDLNAVHNLVSQPVSTIPYPEVLTSLRGITSGEHYLIAPLSDADADWLTARTGELPEGAQVIDPADRYATVLREYRHLSVTAFAFAAAICSVVVVGVYRRWYSILIIVPPILASLVTTAVLSLIGLPFTFFTGMALLVVLGVGIDCAIFQYERANEERCWILAAILLAAVTSALSMGLLGLSETIPVATFGLSVGFGVLISMLLSRMARLPR